MSHISDCINFTSKYTKLISPIIDKKTEEYSAYIERIKKITMKSSAIEALNQNKFACTVFSPCMLYPGIDIKTASEVIYSFQVIIQYLNNICERCSVCTEPFLRLIFSSLKDAVNIRSDSFQKYFTFFPSKDDNGFLSILVEKCRQKVLQLPSYHVVRDLLATYIILYIDMQITKYSSDDNTKERNLYDWSSAHKHSTDISNWEYCMSVDSTMNIQLLLALATNPDLEAQTSENMNSAFFPRICAIHKILEGYLYYNEDIKNENINYLFYYSNLKEYEDRIIYFINGAVPSEPSLKNYTKFVLKTLLSIYITEPKANEGMNRITSRALYSAGGRGMLLYKSSVKLIRKLTKL